MSNEQNQLTLSWDENQIRSKPKNQVFNLFMLSGLTRVYIDTQKMDVKLPQELKQIPTVILELGYDMAKPIPDLTVSDFCFEATLSFGSGLFTCVVPWDCAIAITTVDGLGIHYAPSKEQVQIQEKATKKAKFTLLQGGKN
jgi:hypothetical protein